MKIHKILYFSLNKESVKAFYDYNVRKRACEILSFRLFPQSCGKGEKGPDNFSHASDLISFLEKKEKQNALPHFIVIDYMSLSEPQSGDKADSVYRAREIVLRAIIKYPEINFLFDETRNKYIDEFSFIDFLFVYQKFNEEFDVVREYHTFKATPDIKRTYEAIERGRDNLFDGSNLRYASRRYIQKILKVNRYNFSLFQNSRRDSLALCVEEEQSQNRFNSYALYANGFRVLPVVTANELKYFNSEFLEKYNNPNIIVRDFDLQFPDTEGKNEEVAIGEKKYKINEVDCIRGLKFWEFKKDEKQTCPKGYEDKWYVPQSTELSYWSKLNDIPVYFVSKGVARFEFCKTIEKQTKKRKDSINRIDSPFQDKAVKQHVRGIKKPVSGIYIPFHYIEEIKDRYKTFEILREKSFILREMQSLTKELQDKKNKTDSNDRDVNRLIRLFFEKYELEEKKWYEKSLWFLRLNWLLKRSGLNRKTGVSKAKAEEIMKNQAWVIDTSRENHDHGVPLDVYDLVKSMLERSRKYYENQNYIKAAVISSEVIELLNGFHEALMLQAYHILAISENAIAMNTIGGDERLLKEDTMFRIKKIEQETDRILSRSKDEGQTLIDRKEFQYNVLNQIFSDCRKTCKEKEHFKAEDCFISAMAHVNEGFTLRELIMDFEAFIKRIVNS